MVLMCKMCLKYQCVIRTVCVYADFFQKGPVNALIEACALIRTNTVH